MPEVGEEIVGTWLRYCAKCDFVDYNVSVRDGQGEIDVVGIKLAGKRAYVCEVATHTSGLGYKDVESTLVGKFERAITYATKYLAGFKITYMFWSPLVRAGAQTRAVNEACKAVTEKRNVEISLITNADYYLKLSELRAEAARESASSPHAVFRLLQIEELGRKV